MTTIHTTAERAPAPGWPESGLERIEHCPLCLSTSRTQLYTGLEDRVFGCAPGRWTLLRCEDCRSVYLNPRPNRATIGAAYGSYFTHAANSKDGSGLRGWRRFTRSVGNGYRNARFGTSFAPASRWWQWLLYLRPTPRALIDAEFRSLPRPARASPAPRLLDVGCGNGGFLALAKNMGWEAYGVEPDPAAAAVASSQGVEMLAAFIEDVPASFDGTFDRITLSHVIEHVHDPMALLRACHRLLRGGGTLWVETPNLESLGHRWYGPEWRGLEPPRHLVLFHPRVLQSCLERAGFSRVRLRAPYPAWVGTFPQSERIRLGYLAMPQDPAQDRGRGISGWTWGTRWRAWRVRWSARFDPGLAEFVTMEATK